MSLSKMLHIARGHPPSSDVPSVTDVESSYADVEAPAPHLDDIRLNSVALVHLHVTQAIITRARHAIDIAMPGTKSA